MSKEIEILIAEDDRGHFILTRRCLQEQGIKNRITWFSGGQQVIDFFFNNDNTPKNINGTKYVLLLDLRMPKVDGMEVLKRIRSTTNLMALPVIVLTASEYPKIVEQAYSLGADAYIIKPVKYSTYIEAMCKTGLFPSAIEGGFVLRHKKTHPRVEIAKDPASKQVQPMERMYMSSVRRTLLK